HQGAQGRQPVHGRRNDVQGQAGQQEGSRAAAQEPQGDGQLRPLPPSSASRARKTLVFRAFFVGRRRAVAGTGVQPCCRKPCTCCCSSTSRPWKKCPTPGSTERRGAGVMRPAHSITSAPSITSSASPCT